jgi:hypothetical protein
MKKGEPSRPALVVVDEELAAALVAPKSAAVTTNQACGANAPGDRRQELSRLRDLVRTAEAGAAVLKLDVVGQLLGAAALDLDEQLGGSEPMARYTLIGSDAGRKH